MKHMNRIMTWGLMLLVGAVAMGWAQEQKADRAVVPLSDPGSRRRSKSSSSWEGSRSKAMGARKSSSKPGSGNTSPASEGEGIVPPLPPLPPAGRSSKTTIKNSSDEAKDKAARTAGMKRLTGTGTGLDIEEKDNVVSINTESWSAAVDLTIQVPTNASLNLGAINDGDIVVENVDGEIEVNNINGSCLLRNVSGNVLANSINGEITATIVRAAPDKPMFFSTMNGAVDVTLPAGVKANVKIKTQQGDVYSDFDVALKPASQKAEETPKSDKGRFRISFDNSITGAINGGGPEYTFNSFNGDIYIRKGK